MAHIEDESLHAAVLEDVTGFCNVAWKTRACREELVKSKGKIPMSRWLPKNSSSKSVPLGWSLDPVRAWVPRLACASPPYCLDMLKSPI